MAPSKPTLPHISHKSESVPRPLANRGFNYERYFCIYPGNGHNIIREALLRKRGWKELPVQQAFTNKCNLIWKPTNFSYKMFCQID